MPEVRLTVLERLEAVLAAILVAVAIVGAALLPLTSAAFVRVMVGAVDAAALTGLTPEATLGAAESVRLFVVDRDAPPLPDRVEGVEAFDAAATSHLVDVRSVLIPARQLTVGLIALAVGWALVLSRTPRGRQVVASALSAAGWTLLATGALGVVSGALDFDAFFGWFHGLFFAAGTWTFPSSALLIRVFPLPFWIASAAMWAGLVGLFVVVLFRTSRRLRFTGDTYGV